MIKLPHWPIHVGYSNPDSIAVTKKILELMGSPHKKIKNIIHVSGTNGKGSTVAFISEILRKCGKTVNCYTSPHIFNFTERFSINGINATNQQVFQALEEVRSICEENKINPTVLEASTIAGLHLFSQFPAEYNIIECCMGGMLDNTNIFEIENVACTVITSISFDHTKHLGSTIAEIALHKAGIQKSGVHSVIAKQSFEEANKLLFNFGTKFEIETSFFGTEYSIEIIDALENSEIELLQNEGFYVDNKSSLLFSNNKTDFFLPMPSLLGLHQLENLATALQVCSILNIDFTTYAKNITNAILTTKWTGRLQKVANKFFPQNCEFWFDGAHNSGGAKVLREWILQTQKKEKKDIIIIGKSKNAKQDDFISQFQNMEAEIIFVTVQGEIFPETSTNLHKIAQKLKIPSIDGKTFAETITNLSKNSEIRVICCGSLYLMKDMVYFS